MNHLPLVLIRLSKQVNVKSKSTKSWNKKEKVVDKILVADLNSFQSLEANGLESSNLEDLPKDSRPVEEAKKYKVGKGV